MFRALGTFGGGEGHTNVSFRRQEEWATMALPPPAPLRSTAVLFGADDTGPVLLLLALPPDTVTPAAEAHGHASDTFRTPVAGTLEMGPDNYRPGDFRFQQGWKPYASDNLANGPDGGWTALLFGDRRGMRVRPVRPDGPAIRPLDRAVGEWLGISGDLAEDEPADLPPPSSLVTTLQDRPGRARVNGSFGETGGWFRFAHGWLAAGLIGDATSGPLVLLSRIDGGGQALGSCALGTEVLRLVLRGSCRIGTEEYLAGDIRVEHDGACGPAVAGADGLDEVVVIADRRVLRAGTLADATWAAAVESVTAGLHAGAGSSPEQR